MSSATNTSHKPAHHYRDGEHEFQASLLGVWVFLATEVLMFGGLFVAYVIYHNMYSDMFAEGAKFLDWKLGALNTVVLLFSSLTMAMSIHFIQKNKIKKASLSLMVTLFCGFLFILVKYFEYSHKFHMGLFPGELFTYTGAQHSNLALYFSFYFCMTGLHGLHVLMGMGLIAWVLVRNMRGEFHVHYYTAVEGVGLFWHLVDLIWIYLFPLLYLIG